jgi:hypothetical protein
MKKLKTPPQTRAFSILLLFAVVIAQAIIPLNTAHAAQITARKLTLQASDDGLTGGSKPGGTVNHAFEFTVPSTTPIGSIQIQYCTTPADVGALTCTPPAGLDTSTATLGGSTGVTSLTIVNSSSSVVLQRASTFTPPGNLPVTVLLKGVKNPTAKNLTFFARISTFASLDGSGAPIDTGSTAAATADPILLSGVMPESLVFCTGATVGLDLATSTVPDCSTATTGTIAFNQLFSPTDTATATSQMAASTNASSGYAITVNGTTLTSGSNTIAGIAAAGASVRGTAQFGMNLMANTTLTAASFPGTSADPAPLANAANYRGEAAAGYGAADTFKFVSGNVVADSYNGYVQGTNTAASDAQIYTVSYIANVPGSQPAGTYSTTLTYICTPTY